MQKSENKLGMEIAGFNPLEFFSPEQVEKMRSMKADSSKGLRRHRKSRFGKLLDCLDARKFSNPLIEFKERNKINYENLDID